MDMHHSTLCLLLRFMCVVMLATTLVDMDALHACSMLLVHQIRQPFSEDPHVACEPVMWSRA